MPTITIITGEQAGKQFIIANRPLSIGRDASRDIQIIDPKVSRKHALLRHLGESHIIAPAKPLNGIIINGREIDSEAALRDGDEIALGDTLLRFDAVENPDRTNALHVRKVADRDLRERNTVM